MQRHDLANYLPGDLMFKVDYASMAHGLEVRTPFLSHKVVEFGLNLPSSMKVGARSNKLILRNLANRYLDKELVGRKKKGFAIPREKWIREGLSTQVSELLLDSGSLVRQICQIEMVQQLIRDHSMGAERDEILWPLIILELWHKEYFSAK
jgi:asparagine synthase (glutamine-hydrolysing)